MKNPWQVKQEKLTEAPNYMIQSKNSPQNWQGWPLENRHSDWLDKRTGLLLGFVIIAGAIFCFICGVIAGMVQPPLYNWVMRLLGLG